VLISEDSSTENIDIKIIRGIPDLKGNCNPKNWLEIHRGIYEVEERSVALGNDSLVKNFCDELSEPLESDRIYRLWLNQPLPASKCWNSRPLFAKALPKIPSNPYDSSSPESETSTTETFEILFDHPVTTLPFRG
jgi:hypothetical protein